MPEFFFKIVEAKHRYWHWVLYADGNPIAASASSTTSQKKVAEQVALVQKGAGIATLKMAPMKLEDHIRKQQGLKAEKEDADETNGLVETISNAALNDVGVETNNDEPQSLPPTEAIEG